MAISKLQTLQVLGGPQLSRFTSEKLNQLIEYQKPITLTGKTVVVWRVDTGYNANLLLDSNKTLFFEQLTPGDYGTIKLTQDATGSRTLTLPANSKVSGGGSGILTLSTAANAIDIATFYYDGLNLFWNISTDFS